MRRIVAQIGAADVVLNHIGGKHHAVSSFGGELSHHKILGQVVLKPVKAANRQQCPSPCHDGRAYGEAHAFQHPGHEDAGQEVGIHAGGL